MVILYMLGFAALFAYLGAWHGGNLPPKTPKFIKNSVWAVAQMPAIIGGVWYTYLVAYAGNFLKTMGHGQWYSLGNSIKAIKAERLDFLLVPFFGRDPRTDSSLQGIPEGSSIIKGRMEDYGLKKLYWRCVAGMTLIGLLAASGTTIALIIMQQYLNAAIIAACGGLGKAIGYMLGWKVATHGDNPEPTEIGEYVSAAILGLGVGYVAWTNTHNLF